jgi:hypothetical protein
MTCLEKVKLPAGHVLPPNESFNGENRPKHSLRSGFPFRIVGSGENVLAGDPLGCIVAISDM